MKKGPLTGPNVNLIPTPVYLRRTKTNHKEIRSRSHVFYEESKSYFQFATNILEELGPYFQKLRCGDQVAEPSTPYWKNTIGPMQGRGRGKKLG